MTSAEKKVARLRMSVLELAQVLGNVSVALATNPKLEGRSYRILSVYDIFKKKRFRALTNEKPLL